MKILISNDDGIAADGLRALVRAFSTAGHEVCVSAPDAQRSAASYSLTLARPLTARRMEVPGASAAYAIDGTPVDCVKLALCSLFSGVDMVVSGVNRGLNVGTDTLYSGTVGAAMEGALSGLPAIAVSMAYEVGSSYAYAATLAVHMAETIARRPLPPYTVLNVNCPARGRALGVKVAPLKFVRYVDLYTAQEDGQGVRRYTLTGGMDERMELADDDYSWVKRGYATLSVLTSDLTARKATGALEELL